MGFGQGVSGLNAAASNLDVIGNNIANVNTTAYKSSSVSFADTFSNTLRAASSASGDTSIQIGTGVQVSGMSTNYTQGSLSSTGNATDLAVSGSGYFVVRDANGMNYATRDGAFHFDSSGDLVNAQGFSVVDATGAKINVPNYSSVSSVSVGTDGTVTAFMSDGTSTSTQKVGLLNIPDQAKLMKQGNNLYDFSNAGTTVSNITTPGGSGVGTIESGQLELSNVDLTEQFSNLITTQRSFQAGARLITVSDSVLDDVVNLKRS